MNIGFYQGASLPDPSGLLEGIGVRVRHCRFEQIPSSAIRIEGSEMLIELNEFTRCVWESDDQGAIDMCLRL